MFIQIIITFNEFLSNKTRNSKVNMVTKLTPCSIFLSVPDFIIVPQSCGYSQRRPGETPDGDPPAAFTFTISQINQNYLNYYIRFLFIYNVHQHRSIIYLIIVTNSTLYHIYNIYSRSQYKEFTNNYKSIVDIFNT